MRQSFSKRFIPFSVLLFMLICSSLAMAATPQTTQVTAADVRAEIDDALRAIGSYSAEQRDVAVLKAKQALVKTDIYIEQLQHQLDQNWQLMNQQARAKARAALNALQQQRNDLAEWYGGLKHSSASVWDEIKRGFSNSYEELGRSLEKVRNAL